MKRGYSVERGAASARCNAPRARHNAQAGYALLMAIFLVATLMLLAAVATPSVLNQGRRETEEEVVWRGNQYVRAIRLFYQKNGRFPQTLDDLEMAGIGDIHFLRKAYRDPTNPTDGSWRLIYVSASGQLTGSVHYHSLQEMAMILGGQTPAAGAAGQAGQAAQAGQQPNGTAGQQSGQGSAQTQPGQTPPAAQSLGFGQNTFGQSTFGQGAANSQPAPLQAVDGPVFGASVVGVACKVKKPSLRVFQKGNTYFEWEFIWNPLMSKNGAGQAPGALGGLPGAVQPAGSQSQPGGSQPTQTPGASTNPFAPPNTNPPAQIPTDIPLQASPLP